MGTAEERREVLRQPVIDLIEEIGDQIADERTRYVLEVLDDHRSRQRATNEFTPASGHFEAFQGDILELLRAPIEELWERSLWTPPYVIDFTDGASKREDYDIAEFVPWAARELFEPIIELMNYQGCLDIDPGTFDAWYADVAEPLLSDTQQHTIIAPLLNAELDNEVIELDYNIDLRDEVPSSREPRSLEIAPITRKELGGILTMSVNRPLLGTAQFLPEDQFTHAIKVTVEGAPTGKVGDRLIDRTIAALRLFDRGRHDFGVGPRYSRRPGWLEFREDVAHIVNASKHVLPVVSWGGKWELDSGGLDDFPEFWTRYGDNITGYGANPVPIAISRLSQTYQKQAIEDRLLDLVIALETTVIHQIQQGESYRFRMPVRGAILLSGHDEWPRNETWELLRDAYDARSAVVHAGKTVASALDLDKSEARDFVLDIREVVCLLLVEYIQASLDGTSVTELNRRVDEVLKEAPWPESQDH